MIEHQITLNIHTMTKPYLKNFRFRGKTMLNYIILKMYNNIQKIRYIRQLAARNNSPPAPPLHTALVLVIIKLKTVIFTFFIFLFINLPT